MTLAVGGTLYTKHTPTHSADPEGKFTGGGGGGAQKPKAFTERQKPREGEEYERGSLKSMSLRMHFRRIGLIHK